MASRATSLRCSSASSESGNGSGRFPLWARPASCCSARCRARPSIKRGCRYFTGRSFASCTGRNPRRSRPCSGSRPRSSPAIPIRSARSRRPSSRARCSFDRAFSSRAPSPSARGSRAGCARRQAQRSSATTRWPKPAPSPGAVRPTGPRLHPLEGAVEPNRIGAGCSSPTCAIASCPPLVRYRTGDLASVEEPGSPCACGFRGRSLSRFEGRLAARLLDVSGRRVDPSQLQPLISKLGGAPVPARAGRRGRGALALLRPRRAGGGLDPRARASSREVAVGARRVAPRASDRASVCVWRKAHRLPDLRSLTRLGPVAAPVSLAAALWLECAVSPEKKRRTTRRARRPPKGFGADYCCSPSKSSGPGPPSTTKVQGPPREQI